jgi:hypothetical protein
MTDRPIIFSGPMVRALLDGRKTQTRRVLKGKPPKCPPTCHGTVPCGICGIDPGYAPGDRLWVRETWRTDASMDALKPKKIEAACLDAGYRRPWAPIQYEADGARDNFTESDQRPGKTRVAIHMPRWASRLTLIVDAVKVERLTDISETDAQAEGLLQAYGGWVADSDGRCFGKDPQNAFRVLWEAINGAESWAANPWVVAVSFRVVRANIDDKSLLAGWVAP